MKVMFLDESGHHSLKPRHLTGPYPLFVPGGVIVDRAYAREVIEPDLQRFKLRYFGTTDVILHTVDLNSGDGDYAFLSNAATRKHFYDDLHGLLASWNYQVIGCVINKLELVSTYGTQAEDPYNYSLDVLVDLFCQVLTGVSDDGAICAEKRGGGLDHKLMQRWEAIRTGGTRHTSAQVIDERIISMDLRDKRPNLAAMQLADLVITPIGRHVLGTPEKPNRVQWSVVERKLCRVGGHHGELGLVVRP
ncbi:MAG: hypothetical protein M3Z20_05445 [Chloroflexota bacterium]|nr:hypothetical protein [Chloroflexota bacterium]